MQYYCNVVDGCNIIADEPAVNISAESVESCKLRLDCEVTDSLKMKLSSPNHSLWGGQTINCSASNHSSNTILVDGKNMTIHKTNVTDSNGTSILTCSIIMNVKELPIGEDLLIFNCLNVAIGISRNISYMISNSQGIYAIHCNTYCTVLLE